MDIIVISTITFQALSLIALIMMFLSIRNEDKDRISHINNGGWTGATTNSDGGTETPSQPTE